MMSFSEDFDELKICGGGSIILALTISFAYLQNFCLIEL
jgi:hypothetical protein